MQRTQRPLNNNHKKARNPVPEDPTPQAERTLTEAKEGE